MASEVLAIERIGAAAVAAALALSDAAGWNQTADDWAFFVAHGHVVGCRDGAGRLVASAAALPYEGSVGWLSMVLVAAEHRHRGLATALLADCIAALRAVGRVPVLDATPAGAPVYARLGFAAGFEFERWQGSAADEHADRARAAADGADRRRDSGPDHRPDAGLAPGARDAAGTRDARSAAASGSIVAGAADHRAIVALDTSASGVGRAALLQSFLGRPGTRAWCHADRSGFVIARAGRRARQIGPLVAADVGTALDLLGTALDSCSGPVFLDVPKRWPELARWLEGRGFERQRPFVRMALQTAPDSRAVERIRAPAGAARIRAPAGAANEHAFVLAGPEFG